MPLLLPTTIRGVKRIAKKGFADYYNYLELDQNQGFNSLFLALLRNFYSLVLTFIFFQLKTFQIALQQQSRIKVVLIGFFHEPILLTYLCIGIFYGSISLGFPNNESK